MAMTHRTLTPTLGVLLLASMLATAGCSGSREDVRVSFCKRLVMTQVETPGSVSWTRVETHPRTHDGLAVVLGFTDQDQSGRARTRQASCHYRYNAVDDTALTLSDPLSAYSTSPETMTIDGKPLARSVLARAVKDAVIHEGKAIIDRVQQGLEDATDTARDRLETGMEQGR